MKRRIGFLVGIATAGLISTHCSDDGGGDNPQPTAGTSAGGSKGGTTGGGTGGTAGSSVSGSPSTGGTGGAAPTGGTGGTATGGTGGSAGKGGAGAGGMAGKGGAGAGGAAGLGGKAGAGGGGSGGASGGAAGGGAGGKGGAGGSGGSGGGGGGATAKFADVAKILGEKCGGDCHNGMKHIDLRNDAMLYSRLTTAATVGDCQGKTVVDTAQLGSAILGRVIQTGVPEGTCSEAIDRMPNGCAMDSSKCLSQAQIDTITSWISSGAKNM